jgi:apolipoprotein N-acyltransferase
VRPRDLLAVGTSALLFVAAFPPLSVRWLAWVALVPLFVVVRRSRLRPALVAAGLWGMLAAWGTTDWFPSAVSHYYGQPWAVGFLLFAAAAFSMGAVEYMAFAACYRRAGARGGRPMVLVAASAWTVAEYGRDHLLTGNPWGLLGYSQVPLSAGVASMADFARAAVVQVADVGGVHAVGFVLVAVNALVAEAWLLRFPVPAASGASAVALSGTEVAETSADADAARTDLRGATAKRRRALALETVSALLVVAVALAYGRWRLDAIDAQPAASVPVAIVQANLDLGARWDPLLYGRNLEEHLAWTADALASAPAALVVWPENAVTSFLEEEEDYRRAVAATTGPHGAELLAGAPRRHRDVDAAERYTNSALLLDARGAVVGSYDKEVLLPFAEYFPLSSAGLLRRSFGRVREFTPGEPSAPLATAAGRAGMLLCNEAMFPRLARRRALAGAEILVNLSNDSWVQSHEFAEHQFAIVSMRAIEQRRWLLRSSTSGPSAIVDPAGRVQARTEAFSSGFLSGRVAARRDVSPLARHGDAFVALCAAVTLLAMLVPRRRRDPGR